MKTLTLTDPTLGTISYRDRKRHLWLASLFLPLLALGGIGITLLGGSEWTLVAPLVAIYGGTTMLDWLLGEDRGNPPEELIAQLEADPVLPLAADPDGAAAFRRADCDRRLRATHSLSVVGDAGAGADGRPLQRAWHQHRT